MTLTDTHLVRQPVSLLGLVAVIFPVFGILFSVGWSILYDFEASVRTHCHVANYLPTISSAIGGFTPQRYVWRICVALHIGLRFLLAACYYMWHQQQAVTGPRQTFYTRLVQIAVFCNIVENLSLVTLTSVSSTENGDVHEYAFIAFMACSLLYMLISCCLIRWSISSRERKVSQQELKRWRLKLFLFLFNFITFMVSICLYFRHNMYCEPGIYTWFALGEYLTVFSNIAFHGMCMIDFQSFSLAVMASGVLAAPPFKQQ